MSNNSHSGSKPNPAQNIPAPTSISGSERKESRPNNDKEVRRQSRRGGRQRNQDRRKIDRVVGSHNSFG